MKRIWLWILAVSLIFALAGCKDEADVAEETGVDSKQEEGVKYAGSNDEEISIYSYKPDTFCPILSVNNANIQMLNIVFEGMIQLDEQMQPQPCLAEKWSVSDDGKKWDITLRKDVKWHDGAALTARDAVYTINQIKKNADSLYLYNVSQVDTATAYGQEKLVVELTEPNPNFISLMYFPVIKYSGEDVKKEEYMPVGTGAYIFEDRNEGNIYYLNRNDNWWKGKATTEVVKIKLLPDKDTAMYAFSSGSIDIATIDDLKLSKAENDNSMDFVEIKAPVYSFLGVNHRNSLLAMDEVRAAISYAINREEIINEVMLGYAVPASAPVREEWYVCGGQKFEFEQDVKKARDELLENEWRLTEAKYKKRVSGRDSKLKFDILINEDNTIRANMAQVVEKQLEEFGMEITVTKVPYETYISRISSGNFDTFIGSYSMSPDLKFDFMMGENNAFRFNDEEFRFVLNELKTKTKQEDVIQSYAEIINLFNQVNPVIGLLFENQRMVYNTRISGEMMPSYFDIYSGIENLYIKGSEEK